MKEAIVIHELIRMDDVVYEPLVLIKETRQKAIVLSGDTSRYKTQYYNLKPATTIEVLVVGQRDPNTLEVRLAVKEPFFSSPYQR